MAHGQKRIETRSWSTRYRGLLAIHAAQGFPRAAQELCFTGYFAKALSDAGYCLSQRNSPARQRAIAAGDSGWGALLPRGAVVAVVRLADCRPTGPTAGWAEFLPDWLPAEGTPERAFGDFSPGRYGWFLEDVHRFEFPVSAKGALGLWEWEASLANLELNGLTVPRARAVIDRLQAAIQEGVR